MHKLSYFLASAEPTVETAAARERDSGAIIGIAVGVSVGGALLFVTIIIIIAKCTITRKKQRKLQGKYNLKSHYIEGIKNSYGIERMYQYSLYFCFQVMPVLVKWPYNLIKYWSM